MKFIYCLLFVLFTQIASAQVPDIYLKSAAITTNTNGQSIAKGDTVDMIVMFKDNASSVRSTFLDFQYNWRNFTILSVGYGGALPQGATVNTTNQFYPGYNFVRNANNYTRNGNNNYYNSNYNFTQNGSQAIQRIYSTITSSANLLDSDYVKIKIKVNNVSAGSAYDSIYMNFAAAWGVSEGSNMNDPRATFIQLAAGQNDLVNGNMYKNASAYAYLNFIDSASGTSVSAAFPDVNGVFKLSNQLLPNTTYKVKVNVDSLPVIMQRAVTISDAAAAFAEFGEQNLDGTFKKVNIKTGAGFLASDVNYNGKLDGADPSLLFAHVAGLDTLEPKVYLFYRDTFNVMSTANWSGRDFIYFKTGTSVKDLNVNFLIAGDINRSHSSQVVKNDTIQSFSFVNTPIQIKDPVNVSLANAIIESDNISIPFAIDAQNSSVCGLQFEIIYDPKVLTLDKVEANVNAGWLNFFTNANGKLKFGGLNKTLTDPITGKSVPYVVKFKAKQSGANINSSIAVTNNVDASNNKGSQLGVNLNTSNIRLIGINNFK
jgi:hypothetical protein